MRGVQSSVETVNAAAAIASMAQSRAQQTTSSKRRWWTWLGAHFCFGSSDKDVRRIGDADFVREQISRLSNAPTTGNSNHLSTLAAPLPFVVPPSSPASSLLTSEAPSSSQSPAAALTFSANAYSPPGPSSIFAIGPYAHEPQLVSPPVFSTFTTEPSTAPYTPPPESLHLTNPSSPEVPFARLFASSSNASHDRSDGIEFHSSQFHPGSPIGQLVSPNSACSSTPSPFPDLEFQYFGNGVVQISEAPRILGPEGLASRRQIQRQVRNDGSILDGHITAIMMPTKQTLQDSENSACLNRGVSFEWAKGGAASSSKKLSTVSREAASEAVADDNRSIVHVDQTYHDLPMKVQPAVYSKDFKFDNSDGSTVEPNTGSVWWVKKAVAAEPEPQKSWQFFPMIDNDKR